MKAIVLEKYGSIQNLQFKEYAKPLPSKDEVVIKVHFAAVNPYDIKVIEVFGKEFQIPLPVIPGSELSGIITEVGEGVTEFKVGDAVCGNKSQFGGCFAEYAIAKTSDITGIPESVSFETAAAATVGSLTAWKALLDTAKLTSGQRVLIHGGGGNVGSMAIQLAKKFGAYVITTSSIEDEQKVKSIGADECINYKSEDFSLLAKDIDIVLDTVGGEVQQKSFQVLKPGGFLISLIEPPSPELAEKYQVKAQMIFGGPVKEWLQKTMEWVKNGDLKVFVGKIFSLDEAIAALEWMKAGKGKGKTMLKVK